MVAHLKELPQVLQIQNKASLSGSNSINLYVKTTVFGQKIIPMFKNFKSIFL
jgi:hypothetical protein